MIFYHGTDEISFQSIIKDGFSFGKITTDPNKALEIAQSIAKEKKLKPIVCKIDTTLDTLILTSDKKDSKDWRSGLKEFGFIYCSSWINPNVISSFPINPN